MKKIAIIIVIILLMTSLSACRDKSNYEEVSSTIIRKEIVDGNQYYFHVEYRIEGLEGLFEASIKVRNQNEFDRYGVGDQYKFERPVANN